MRLRTDIMNQSPWPGLAEDAEDELLTYMSNRKVTLCVA